MIVTFDWSPDLNQIFILTPDPWPFCQSVYLLQRCLLWALLFAISASIPFTPFLPRNSIARLRSFPALMLLMRFRGGSRHPQLQGWAQQVFRKSHPPGQWLIQKLIYYLILANGMWGRVCWRFGAFFFPLCLKRKPMGVFLFLLVDMKRKIDAAATSSHYSIAMKETRLKIKLTWPVVWQKRLPRILDNSSEPLSGPTRKSALSLLFH